MQPKIRSPLASWLLTVCTGGAYLFFWVWRVATELNGAENKNVFRIDVWRKAFLVLLLLAFVGLVFVAQANNPIPIAMAFLCFFILFIYVQLAIGNYIKWKDKELNTGATYSNAASVVLLWFVASLGVAYMQSGINRVIKHERVSSRGDR
jgi:succinate dehydrogenase hydrophobic anchor subunit